MALGGCIGLVTLAVFARSLGPAGRDPACAQTPAFRTIVVPEGIRIRPGRG